MGSERKWNGMNWLWPTTRLAIHLRDEFKCAYCRRDLHNVRQGELQVDHLVAVACGGSNKHYNLVTCCADCNARKGDKPWRTFVRELVANKLNGPGFDIPLDQILEAAEDQIRRVHNQRRRILPRSLARDLMKSCTCGRRKPTCKCVVN